MTGRLTHQISDAFLAAPPETLGVAVSGGGDSMALLHLLHSFCALHGTKLRAVTVNHGLRPAAAEEARMVHRECTRLGVLHDTLLWDDWDGQGNLQAAARDARYARMAAWASRYGIETVALGHTADDQAETVLMRLARKAGVNGLAGMAPRKLREGITWVRPLLGAGRAELRDYLRLQNVSWIDDPSNDDLAFARVRARQVLAALEPLGIDAATLSEVAVNMSQARTALDWQTFLVARDIASVDAGAVVLCERQLRLQPDEIQRRLIVQALNWVSGAHYPPRSAAVAHLQSALRRGMAGTVDGCHARRVEGRIWIFRELNAVKDEQATLDMLWDQRWRLSPPKAQHSWHDVTVRALGDNGIEQCPDWRASGRPHAVLLSTPAVWRGTEVVAAPLANWSQNWQAHVDGGPDAFFAALLSH